MLVAAPARLRIWWFYPVAATTNRASAISAEATDDPANGPKNITNNSVPIRRMIVRSCVALILGGEAGGGSNPPGAGGHAWESKNITLR